MTAYSTAARPRPGKVTTIAVMTLISGIVNILWGLVLTASLLVGVLSGAVVSFGIGLLCAPVACVGLLPVVLGIFEIINGAQLLSQPPKAKPSMAIVIMEIICILTANIYAVIVGIITLILANDPEVKNYF